MPKNLASPRVLFPPKIRLPRLCIFPRFLPNFWIKIWRKFYQKFRISLPRSKPENPRDPHTFAPIPPGAGLIPPWTRPSPEFNGASKNDQKWSFLGPKTSQVFAHKWSKIDQNDQFLTKSRSSKWPGPVRDLALARPAWGWEGQSASSGNEFWP